ncbi:MAG: outer membrane lipoprotein-sorting protein [Treponema sp.]|nr:outer membrane lipoprotein-sorting protein [Treponema sp.]
MKKLYKVISMATLALTLGTAAVFADQQGTDIMQKAKDIAKPKFTHSMVEMVLTAKNGTQEVRSIEQYGRNQNDLTDIVMLFRSPASVKDTRFLQKENKGKDDDKWIYLPALQNTRRVNSSEGSKSFMGTDATYDDLSTREIDEDDHQYEGEESKVVGSTTYNCYKVKEVPYDKKSSQYSYRITWVDKDTYVPVYTEMYDKNSKLVKVLTVPTIKKEGGYTITYESLLENVQTGHKTNIKIVRLELDKPIPDRVFTSNFLNTGK